MPIEHLNSLAFRTWIDEAEQHSRFSDYTEYENYYLGQFNKVTLPKHITDCLSTDVATKANICRAIIDTKVQYICGQPVGITVEGDQSEQTKQAEEFLYTIYKNNGLVYKNMLKAIRILAKKGDVFLKIDKQEAGGLLKKYAQKIIERLAFWKDYTADYANKIKVNVVNPNFVLPKYSDNNYEEMELCAVKYFTYNDKGEKEWKAEVWYPDVKQYWTLKILEQSNKSTVATEKVWNHIWQLDMEEENKYGFIPFIHIINTIDDRDFGISDLHDIVEIQNNYNKTLTDLAIGMDYQAFQRIFIIGAMTKAGKQWDISPGTITEIPGENAKVTFIPNADMSPYLESLKMIKALACEVSQTPQIALGTIEGGVPSGYALRIHYQPLENKCNETKVLLQDAFQALNEMIFVMAEIDGTVSYAGMATKLQFMGGLPVDKDSVVKTHTQQIANGTLSKETSMQEEGVEDIDEENERIRAESMETDLYGSQAERIASESTSVEDLIKGLNLTKEAQPAEVPIPEGE